MTNPALEKGNELETAVRRIETAILKTRPGLSEGTFRIEGKKQINSRGVRHEIDIFVEVDLCDGYKANFIFECKNWSDSVGKNEIIVFSEKIQATLAQTGFFVARSFTRDAVAQAAKDERITLLSATEVDAPLPFSFHVVGRENTVANIDFYQQERLGSARERVAIDISSVSASLDGFPIDLRKYMDDWVVQVCDTWLSRFNSEKLPEGSYPAQVEDSRQFEPGSLVIDAATFTSAQMTASFDVRVCWPQVTSHFEVVSRGRSIAFAPVRFSDGGVVEFGFTQLPN